MHDPTAASARCTGAAAPALKARQKTRNSVADFVLESREHLATIEAQALTLERDPSDGEALNSAFRGFHTIKGLAGFLEFWDIQELAHEVEAVLDRARNGAIDHHAVRPSTSFLQAADYLRRWMASHRDRPGCGNRLPSRRRGTRPAGAHRRHLFAGPAEGAAEAVALATLAAAVG